MAEEKKLILCVEDEKELREDIAEELRSEGYEVVEAANGEEAMQKLSQEAPDLIISDINMPIMNGYELIAKVRAENSEYAKIPFVFLSAYSDRKDVLKGYETGVDDYICKPIDYDILIAKATSIIKRTGVVFEPQENVNTGSEHADISHSNAVDTVKNYLKKHENAKLGKITYLNIQVLEKVFGDKWSKWVPNILLTTEKVINSKISSQDVCLKVGKFEYLLMFAELSQEEAVIKTQNIAEMIKSKLIGDNAAFDAVTLYSEAVDISDLLGVSSKQDDENKKDPMRQRLDEILSHLKVKFSAVWNYQKGQVVGYFCVPHTEKGGKFIPVVSSLSGMNPSFISEYDRFVIGKCFSASDVRTTPENMPILIVPLHVESVIFESTHNYLNGLANSWEFPKNHIFIELLFNEKEDAKMLHEAQKLCKDCCAAVIFRNRAGVLKEEEIVKAGIQISGFFIGDSAWASENAIETFSNLCSQTNLRKYVLGVNKYDQVTQAKMLRYSLIAGNSIAPLKDHPTEAYSLKVNPH
ncbi:MAG: response regulator [Alphaproteobacteria bacterium]